MAANGLSLSQLNKQITRDTNGTIHVRVFKHCIDCSQPVGYLFRFGV